MQQTLEPNGLEAYLRRSEQFPHKIVPLDISISISWPHSEPYDSINYLPRAVVDPWKPPGHQQASPFHTLMHKLMWTLGGRPLPDMPLRQTRWRSLQVNKGESLVGTSHPEIRFTLPAYMVSNLQILELRGIHLRTETTTATALRLKQLTLRGNNTLTGLHMPKVEMLRIEDDVENTELIEWYHRLPALKTIEIFSPSVAIPSRLVVPQLSTLILHSETTLQQMRSLSLFNALAPLDMLVLYDMTPRTILGLMSQTKILRFKTLKITAAYPWMLHLETIREGI
ncbi:hypothetical protein FRC17_009195 [Serendipita sp. 399]|nr:hypothetical protein FRC17_009195 [Serendipita sp. 399]